MCRPGGKARKWCAAVLAPLRPGGDLGEGGARMRWTRALEATALDLFDAAQRYLFLPLARRATTDMARAFAGNGRLPLETYPSVSARLTSGHADRTPAALLSWGMSVV